MQSLRPKMGFSQKKRGSCSDKKNLHFKTVCVQNFEVGVSKKRRLERTQEDLDASMAMTPFNRKMGFTPISESWSDKSLHLEPQFALKPMGSIGGVLKTRKLEITRKDLETSVMVESLKIKLVCKKKIQSWADKSILLKKSRSEKPTGSVVGGVLKKRKLEGTEEEEEEEENGNSETPLKTTEFHAEDAQEEKGNAEPQMKTSDLFADARRVLSDWKMIKRGKQREAARLELEQIRNTVCFEDNMEAMREFEKIIGYSMTYATFYTREYCFGSFEN